MDQLNHLIRRVDAEGTITTYAGVVETRAVDADGDPTTELISEVTKGWPGYAGDGGPVSEARFYGYIGGAYEPSSRITIAGGRLYVADTLNHLIRVIDLEAGTIERFAGAVSARAWDHDQWSGTPEVVETRGWPGYGGDGGDRLDAAFNGPTDVEVDVDGSVFVADTSNHCVRKIDPTGIVTTVAGMCGQPGGEGDGGPATEAKLYRPSGIALAPNGDLVIADTANHVFRVVHRGE
jgi:DNA-binding beta-propeller fold protein YncE